MNSLSRTLLLAIPFLVVACVNSPADTDPADRGPLGGKADNVTGTCTPADCGDQAADGNGWCDDACAAYGDCAAGVAEVCQYDQCHDDAGCDSGEACVPGRCGSDSPGAPGWCEPSHCEPVEPEFCANGRVVVETYYLDSADAKECSMPRVHCVTNDYSACPLRTPLPPTYCTSGTVVQGASVYIASLDGMECEQTSVHCVTNDYDACPQLQPLPPTYCADGTIAHGTPSFVDSTDGMQCELPSVHCLTNDHDACPQF